MQKIITWETLKKNFSLNRQAYNIPYYKLSDFKVYSEDTYDENEYVILTTTLDNNNQQTINLIFVPKLERVYLVSSVIPLIVWNEVNDNNVKNYLNENFTSKHSLILLGNKDDSDIKLCLANYLNISSFYDYLEDTLFDKWKKLYWQWVILLAKIFTSSLEFTNKQEQRDWKPYYEMYNGDRIEEALDKIDSLIQEIYSSLEKKWEVSKEKFAEELVHTIYSKYEYDERFNILSWQNSFDDLSRIHTETFNIFNILFDWKWVCQTFSQLYALIILLSRCWTASVEFLKNEPAINHFNNIVSIEWKWYSADCTFNSFKELKDIKTKKSVSYF